MKTQYVKHLLNSWLFSSLLIFGFLLNQHSAEAFQNNQRTYTEYEGIVLDSNSKKPLVSAQINLAGTNISTITNLEGEFLIKVPEEHKSKNVEISFLGYKKAIIALTYFEGKKTKFLMDVLITQLNQVSIVVPKDAASIVKMALDKRGDAYLQQQLTMTGFYRETIKKRRKNASLSEAVVEIQKHPYQINRRDEVSIIKARKSTDYTRLDTLAVKLQGGPFNTLFSDLVKYPIYVFDDDYLEEYTFTLDRSTQINDRAVYVVNFKQNEDIDLPRYFGKLFIDSKTFALVSAIYELNVENKELASRIFIRKKPRKAKVYPTKAAYKVDYKTVNDKWYYSYSNIQLSFLVNYDKKLFNSVYTLSSEMAITDWNYSSTSDVKPVNTIKPSVILSEEIRGFGDPNYWGEYNIIEPEKSIETAIRKIKNKIKKS